MRYYLKYLCIVITILPTLIVCGQIPGINFTSCIDNTIYEESNSLSNGAGDYIIVGRAGPDHGNNIRRGLIMTEFDLIPSSATIISAKLVILGATGASQTVRLHRALKAWNEGSSDAVGDEFGGAAATTNDATWSHSDYSLILWANAGGDFDPVPSSTLYAKPNISNEFTGAKFTADVQGWVDGSLSNNYGWIMIGDESYGGNSLSLQSGDINSGIPYINVKYTLPERQVIINEIDPSNKWVELYNSGSGPVDIGDWYLANNANNIRIDDPGITFLNGNTIVPAQGYVRIAWGDISTGAGEIALVKSSSTFFAPFMEDYVQYGAVNQFRSAAAVSVGLWDDNSSFVPSPGVSKTIGLDANYYANGEATSQGSWEEQASTPNQQNVCHAYLDLTSPIELGHYSANQLDYNGVSQTGSSVGLHFGDFVEFKPNAIISNGTVLQAIKRDCTN